MNHNINYELKSPQEVLIKTEEMAVTVTKITISEPNKIIANMAQPFIKIYSDTMYKIQMESLKNINSSKPTKSVDEIQDELYKQSKEMSVIDDIKKDVRTKQERIDDIKSTLFILYSLSESDYKICDNVFTNILIQSAYFNDNIEYKLTKSSIDQLYAKDYQYLMGEFLISFLE